jgi:glycine betaine/proline transport system substrate-binding protein
MINIQIASVFIFLKAILIALILPVSTFAVEENERCETVRFSNVGWTDIAATTALASEVLESIGYKTTVQMLAAPVTYKSLANGDLDVFLGNWIPTMVADFQAYQDRGELEMINKNLVGAKYTLAVPKYVYDAGVRKFNDLVKYKQKLKGKIYAIEPGNDGNRIIQEMIDKNAFNLSSFEMVESSEAGMLSQVKRAVRRKQWIVFLGWEPHPMNTHFDMAYLEGGDDFFGPDLGGASVHTAVRKNYLTQCPNVGRFLKNLTFTLNMENEVMDIILSQGKEPRVAAKDWIVQHPEVLDQWLDGVKIFRGDKKAIGVAKSSF